MSTLRKPAVAGQFYPETKDELAKAVRGILEGGIQPSAAVAIVVPHAGYMYSGAVAGATFSRVRLPDRIVILGVNHYGAGVPVAAWESGEWETPLGRVTVDAELVAAIIRQAPFVQHDPRAHVREHSLEVQLPFLQVMSENPPRIAPFAIASHDPALLKELGYAVAEAIRDTGERVLIVASTDLTHYEPAATARKKDMLAVDRIRALDGPGLLRTVIEKRISMCGVGPTTAALVAAADLGAGSAELVRYSTSGDVTGDNASVVGYAGLVAH